MKNGETNPTALSPPPKPPRLGAIQKVRHAFPNLMASLASGTPMQQLLDALDVDWRTFYDFIDKSPDRAQAYSRARRICTEKWVSEIVPMSDAVIGQEMAVVTATRNAVDARKWMAGKLAPREYGDAPGGVTINQQTNVMVVSEDRLKQLQALRQQMLNSSPSTPPS